MTTINLKTLKPNTRFVDVLFIVKEASVLTKKNNDLYLSLILENKTGTIKAVYWGEINDEARDIFNAGNVVMISGNVTAYQNINQITINDYGRAPDDADTSALIKEAPFEAEQMINTLKAQVNAFTNNDLKAITLAFLDKYDEKLRTHPAAKRVHHSYKGGLLYHTCSILTLSKPLVALHSQYIDQDLLTAGIILHDLGKISEYTSYFATDITLNGRLKGHIAIMSEEIEKMADEIGFEDPYNLLKLQHMILSHHGSVQNGWGSTVSPQLIEAHILHKLDQLDAEMDAYKTTIDQTNLYEFSAPVFGISNSKFYKHIE